MERGRGGGRSEEGGREKGEKEGVERCGEREVIPSLYAESISSP